MENSLELLTAALRAVGLRPGGVVLVHSSLRALGPVIGGAETVVRALLEALGTDGTLLIPALSYLAVNAQQPLFDVQNTPSNIGVLPEYFRTRAGTLRSMHPTHSVCGIGPQAATLLQGHELDSTPCGANSPFRRLAEVGGQICFLGCGLLPNTSMHAIEECINPPYLFGPEVRVGAEITSHSLLRNFVVCREAPTKAYREYSFVGATKAEGEKTCKECEVISASTLSYRLRFADGREIEKIYRTHGFQGWVQRYDRMAGLLNADALRTGTCLQGTVHLLEARAMWERGLAQLAADPLFFVDREEQRKSEEWKRRSATTY